MDWSFLNSIEDWQAALGHSQEQPIVVFKHSTRCSVSFMARKRFEAEWNENEQVARPYFLDLIAHRDVSNRIAEDTGVRHESPQMILIDKGKVLYHASHYAIDPEALIRRGDNA